eukprot:2258739-Rhodomonas_salina.2
MACPALAYALSTRWSVPGPRCLGLTHEHACCALPEASGDGKRVASLRPCAWSSDGARAVWLYGVCRSAIAMRCAVRIVPCICYAACGTDRAYAATYTRFLSQCWPERVFRLCAGQVRGRRNGTSPHIGLRAPDEKSGTDLGYPTTSLSARTARLVPSRARLVQTPLAAYTPTMRRAVAYGAARPAGTHKAHGTTRPIDLPHVRFAVLRVPGGHRYQPTHLLRDARY